MQVYTGQPIGGAPVKNTGMWVVLNMAEVLRGHNLTCDNLFTSYNLGQERKRKLTMIVFEKIDLNALPNCWRYSHKPWL